MLKRILTFGMIFLFIFSPVTPIVIGYGTNLLFDGSYDYHPQLNIEPPNIMLTGYWNPTGQMIAPFSNDPYLNPDGWIGANWENSGYNIYSFFPTPGTYNGTFEVDYQDTWDDFWNITAQFKPIAIISFGVGSGPWEIEYNARNLDKWVNDNEPPYQPTPCPPDDSAPVGYIRHSSLPVQEIEDAVNEQTSVKAWVDWDGNPEAYLCEYMAYLGMWYQSIHNNDSLYPCKAAGFIHVKDSIAVEVAMEVTNVTIRETIKYLSCVKNPPETPAITGPTRGKLGEEYEYTFCSTDPDDDDVFYYINWRDDTFEKWIGPFESGENMTVSHNWSSLGIYEIKVMAKDPCGAISDWGTLKVKIPRNRAISNVLFLWFFQKFPIIQKLLYLIK